MTADSGFHSEKNIEMVTEESIDSYIADPQHRQRDPRFDDAKRYRKSIDISVIQVKRDILHHRTSLLIPKQEG